MAPRVTTAAPSGITGSTSASGTSTPGAGPSSQTLLDIYRPLSSTFQKPLAPFLPSSTVHPNIQELLGLDDITYRDRVEGKTLLLDGSIPTGGASSSLVTGRKRNRGNPAARQAAREAVQGEKERRDHLGLSSLRKARKRGGITNGGGQIDYNSLIPLHHLHTNYLFTLLNLPPLPTPVPELARLPVGLSLDSIASRLIKADFTGIILSVVSSRSSSLNGLRGIVIEETEATFRIVGTDNRIRIIPKEGTQFGISLPVYSPVKPSSSADTSGEPTPIDVEGHLEVCPRVEMTMLGTNFGYRSGDRAGRKFKLAQGDGGGNGWGEEWVRGEWDGVFTAIEGSSNAGKKAEKGLGGGGMRKKGKSRRKDPLAGGTREVIF